MSVLTVYNPKVMGKEVKRAGRLFIRLSVDDEAYLDALVSRTGLTKTGVIVQAIRDMARSKRVVIQPEALAIKPEENA
jgi:hypothetical protein